MSTDILDISILASMNIHIHYFSMSVITSLILWTLRKSDILGFEVLMQLPKKHRKPTCNGCFWMFMFPFMEHSHIQWCYLKKVTSFGITKVKGLRFWQFVLLIIIQKWIFLKGIRQWNKKMIFQNLEISLFNINNNWYSNLL